MPFNLSNLVYPVFNTTSYVEVCAVLANCGDNLEEAREALVRWIISKRRRRRSEEHINDRMSALEEKFRIPQFAHLHIAFHQAREETGLPHSDVLPADLTWTGPWRKRQGDY